MATITVTLEDKSIVDAFNRLQQASCNMMPAMRIIARSITAFEQAKTDYSNISGGDIYFNDLWENSLSESGAPISEIDNIKKLLQDLKYNYYEKKAEFEENKKVITDMENKLIEIISSNPGIRQSEIYEMFEEQFKNDIRLILFHWSREKRISRLRSLNTYRLYYKKD